MKKIFLLGLVIVMLPLIVSCDPKTEPVLSITGLVEASFSQSDLESMPVIEVYYTNKDGETAGYSGVAINEILLGSEIEKFTSLNIVASDGYSVKVTFDELSMCSDCVLSFSKENNWSSVMPNFPGKLQVKDVIELNLE
jgi:hypothetical protein